jgi:phosphatidylinositol 4-phosphatase
MDNLDRTNVAQAAFAKWTLTQQLRELGVFEEHESVDDHEALTAGLRESLYLFAAVTSPVF